MFQNLSKYKYIIVTGCQRSGTRITAKCIAHDTGHKYIDEQEFGTLNFIEFVKKLAGKPKVFHAPALSSVIHFLGRNDILVVFVKRNKEDILASQKKISWDSYNEELCYHFPDDLINATYSYAKIQSQFLNYIEVEYETLNTHPLWVSNRNFKWNQTT